MLLHDEELGMRREDREVRERDAPPGLVLVGPASRARDRGAQLVPAAAEPLTPFLDAVGWRPDVGDARRNLPGLHAEHCRQAEQWKLPVA